MKKLSAVLIVLFVLAGIWFGLRFIIGGPEDTWICEDGQWVKHGAPSAPMPTEPCGEGPVACTMEAKLCPDGSYVGRTLPNCDFAACPGEKEGILISSPKTDAKIKSPLKITGQARGVWYFEAQFTAELYDANDNFLGRAILTAKDDWMTENFVPFEGELVFTKPPTSLGTLKFLSANPSGLTEHQKLFEVQIRF